MATFGSRMGEATIKKLRHWTEFQHHTDCLQQTLEDTFRNLKQEREMYRKRLQKINRKLKKHQQMEVKPANYQEIIDELEQEREIFNSIIHDINTKDTLNFLTDEGLLPNYAFPESGVTLKSIIWQKIKKRDSTPKIKSKTFTYERPASSAIAELAPSSRFYAQGRSVEIDQIDLNVSSLEKWQFCDKCSYMEKCSPSQKSAQACPQCGSEMWSDIGQKRDLIRLKQVFSTTHEKDSFSFDESENREPEFFSKHLFVQINPEQIQGAYQIKNEQYPFGFEFIAKATFREVNFGREAVEGSFHVAGREYVNSGFEVCQECGRVQQINKNFQHALGCKYRSQDDSKAKFNALFLYREFSSEAIRILLPIATLDIDKKLQSFSAAFHLGLRKKFKGEPYHLSVTFYDEPEQDTDLRRRYMVLYDTVPGGTGYLRDLMRSSTPAKNVPALFEIFRLALNTLRSCECNQNFDKDGCYSCIYAYRGRYNFTNTSRNSAIAILTEILRRENQVQSIDTIQNLGLSPIMESELETLFITSLQQIHGLQIRPHLIRGKQGYRIEWSGYAYDLEPQVYLDREKSVIIPSRADFVLWPQFSVSSIQKALPVAVFLDGYEYHVGKGGETSRLDEDLAQRMAIIQSGKFLVWSLTWKDVEVGIQESQENFYDYSESQIQLLNKMLKGENEFLSRALEIQKTLKVPRHRGIFQQNSYYLLLLYMGFPQPVVWQKLSSFLAMSFLQRKVKSSQTPCVTMTKNLIENTNLDIEMTLEAKKGEDAYMFGLCSEQLQKKCYTSYFICASTPRLTANHEKAFTVVGRIEDQASIPAKLKSNYRFYWNTFLHYFNWFQFLPNTVFLSQRGIARHRHDRIIEKFYTPPVSAAQAWYDVKELVLPLYYPLLEFLSTRSLPIPEPGYELTDKKGRVLGSCELGWPQLKVAFMREEEWDRRHVFLKQGWSAYLIDEVQDNLEKAQEILIEG